MRLAFVNSWRATYAVDLASFTHAGVHINFALPTRQRGGISFWFDPKYAAAVAKPNSDAGGFLPLLAFLMHALHAFAMHAHVAYHAHFLP